MLQAPKFQSGRDIARTVPGLQVDIPESMDYNRIKDTSVPSMYNGQKDLADVGMRIHEPFDAIEYDRAYTKIRHYHSSKKESKEAE